MVRLYKGAPEMNFGGLTTYQSKAYLALKSEGGLTPTEIGNRSGVPQSKIYETLYSLERLGLVKSHLNKEGRAEIDSKINEFSDSPVRL